MREINRFLSDALLSLAEGLWIIAEARAGFRSTEAQDFEQAAQLLRMLYRYAERVHEAVAANADSAVLRQLYRELSEISIHLPIE